MQHASDLDFEHDHHKGDGHPSVLFYNIIAISLFVVTALEVAVLYPPLNEFSTQLKVLILLVLSVIGTGTVAALINVMPAAEHPLSPRGKPAHVQAAPPGQPGAETPAPAH